MSSCILPRASQTAQGGWRLQWYGQGGAASRCGLGWQQKGLCNILSWIKSEIRPWHLLQRGAAAGLLSTALETVFSIFSPSDTFPTTSFKAFSSSKPWISVFCKLYFIVFQLWPCSHHKAKGLCTGLGAALCPALSKSTA